MTTLAKLGPKKILFIEKLPGVGSLVSPEQKKEAWQRQYLEIKGKAEAALLRLNGEQSPGAPAEVLAVLRYRVHRPTAEVLSRPGWLRSAHLLPTSSFRPFHILAPASALLPRSSA